jgi:hypothetical protein
MSVGITTKGRLDVVNDSPVGVSCLCWASDFCFRFRPVVDVASFQRATGTPLLASGHASVPRASAIVHRQMHRAHRSHVARARRSANRCFERERQMPDGPLVQGGGLVKQAGGVEASSRATC